MRWLPSVCSISSSFTIFKLAPPTNAVCRTPVQEADEHLLPDAGDHDHPVPRAGPTLADPDPAGAVVVELALAVPGELGAHPAELVDVDLLPGGPDHGGALHAADLRLRGL